MKSKKIIKIIASITTMGAIGTGTAIGISSCGGGDTPSPGPTPVLNYLEITQNNMSTYFNGTFPTLGSPKTALADYLTTQPNINELKFTDFTAISDNAFSGAGDYLKSITGQIKTIDFNNTAPILIGQ
jgi:hypothetical protein